MIILPQEESGQPRVGICILIHFPFQLTKAQKFIPLSRQTDRPDCCCAFWYAARHAQMMITHVGEARIDLYFSTNLDLDLPLNALTLLALVGLGFSTHDTTSPVALGLLVLLEVSLLDGLDEFRKLRLVLGADLSDGKSSGGLVGQVSIGGSNLMMCK